MVVGIRVKGGKGVGVWILNGNISAVFRGRLIIQKPKP